MYNPSNLRELLEIVASKYLDAKREQFAKHPLADMLRKKPREIISIEDFDYLWFLSGNVILRIFEEIPSNWTTSPT